MPKLTCGVALITYNGLKYLPQQLDSIVSQTRAVDHIVISDDGSTDGTLDYLETWSKQCGIPVTLLRNVKQYGLIQNFERAASAVDADIIFASDQDDVWLPQKVELLAAMFEAQPDLQLVHTDAILVDANGSDMGTFLFAELGVTDAERSAIHSGEAFSVFCRRNLVTGATAAFRRTLLELARPLPATTYHDAWLALIASATGKVRLLDTPTIHYRQHGSNMVGVKKLGPLAKMRRFYWAINNKRPLSATVSRIISLRTELYARLSAYPAVARPRLALAKEALDFAQYRAALPGNPVLRTGAVLHKLSAGQYSKFSDDTWSDALRDLLRK